MAVDIERINELARISRTRALTEEEKADQATLRRAYIDSVLGNLKSQLDVTYVVDEHGNKHKVSPKSPQAAQEETHGDK